MQGVGVEVAVGVGVGVNVAVAVGVGVNVAVAVGVGLGLAVAVAVGVGLAVGVGVAVPPPGAGIATFMGEPVLKKLTIAFTLCGAESASNRKLYNVPKRIAFALGFCAKVSVNQVIELPSLATAALHGVLLYPVFPWVPSFAQPGS
jgi:hypothetical protein